MRSEKREYEVTVQFAVVVEASDEFEAEEVAAEFVVLEHNLDLQRFDITEVFAI